MTLHLLLEAEGKPKLYQHVAVFLAACDVVDTIMLVTTARAKPRLQAAISRWFDLHVAQYGTQYVKPKFFWMRAVALRVDESEWLFDMFYVERQH